VVVRVGFRRHIQTASTGTSYHVKFVDDIWTACTVNMNDVQGRARCSCVRKNFLKANEGSLGVLAASANVHVDRGAVACGGTGMTCN
jgi:hypothetical protein